MTQASQLAEYTVLGNPVLFNTNVSDALTGLTIPFTPEQSGSGDPSPDNIRPVIGKTSIVISHSGVDTSNPATYMVSFPSGAGTIYGGELNAITGVLTAEWVALDLSTVDWNYTSGQLRFYKGGYNNYIGAPTQTTLPPIYCTTYKLQTIGNINTNTSLDNVIGFSNGQITLRDLRFSTKQAMNEYLSSVSAIVVLQLVTPQTYQLDPLTINTIIGTNTIWTDTNGSNTIKYLKKG